MLKCRGLAFECPTIATLAERISTEDKRLPSFYSAG
jgi:hypothetical protein